MLRYLALILLVGCSASAGGVSADAASAGGALGDEPADTAGATAEPTAGEPSGGDVPVGGRASGGSPAGGVVAKGGQPEPSAGAVAVAGAGGSGGSGGSGGASPMAGAAGSRGGTPASCPAEYYCHELGPDAFAKCVIRPADPDPRFPMCTITEGACFYPQTAPESCIKAECWKMLRSCP